MTYTGFKHNNKYYLCYHGRNFVFMLNHIADSLVFIINDLKLSGHTWKKTSRCIDFFSSDFLRNQYVKMDITELSDYIVIDVDRFAIIVNHHINGLTMIAIEDYI